MKTKLILIQISCGTPDFNNNRDVLIGIGGSFFVNCPVDEDGKCRIDLLQLPGYKNIPRGQTISGF